MDKQFLEQIILNGDGTCKISESNEALNQDQIAWQRLDLSKPQADTWLSENSGLDHSAIMALSAMETRPRSFKDKKGILIILRGVNLNHGYDPEDMVSVRIWFEKKRVVTVQRRPVMSVQDVVQDLEKGQGPKTTGEFLVELVDKIADRIGDYVEEIDNEIEALEDNLDNMELVDLRTTHSDLRKKIATVRRYLAPQRDALDRLNRLDSELFSDKDLIRLREESDRVSRYLEDLDLARERTVVLQEAFLSQVAQQQNNRVYALSIITAVFLPLGFVTGLLGINVGGLPGVEHPLAFWIVCILLLVIAFGIMFIFRKMKWF